MRDVVLTAVSAVGGLAALWIVLVAVLLSRSGTVDRTTAAEAVRLLPDTGRLIHRLARDRSLPRGVRTRLWLTAVYLVLPVDLIPDFVPVLGFADDVIVVALALRSTIKAAGYEAVERHWPGTPDGLMVITRLMRLTR